MITLPWNQFLFNWYSQPLFSNLQTSNDYQSILTERSLQSPQILSQVLLNLSLALQPNYTNFQFPFSVDYLCGKTDSTFYQLSQQYASFLSVHSHPDADHAVHLTHPEWISSFLDQILIPLQA